MTRPGLRSLEGDVLTFPLLAGLEIALMDRAYRVQESMCSQRA
jgi:hypothetical protein